MTHRPLLIGLSMLAALSLWLTACSDDDPVAPEDSFAIDITVLDAQGQPVADRPVIVLPVLPPGVFQDDLQAAMPAAVQIPFFVPEPCHVDLEIRDVAGATIRTVIADYEAPAGEHHILWNGLDDDGIHQGTGWYAAVLTCRDAATGDVLFTDSRGMLMVLLDFDQTEFRTDADGKLTITDRRVVPGFWDPPELRFTDENGDLIGLYTLTRATQVRAGGGRVDFEAIDGWQRVTVQPEPQPATGSAGATVLELLVPRLLPDDAFELGDPSPNPFN